MWPHTRKRKQWTQERNLHVVSLDKANSFKIDKILMMLPSIAKKPIITAAKLNFYQYKY